MCNSTIGFGSIKSFRSFKLSQLCYVLNTRGVPLHSCNAPLSQLKQLPGIEIGLYRDDRLSVLNQTPQERAKKEIRQIFARNNLKFTIEANKKVVNFLNVTLDLTGKFKPYTKPISTPPPLHNTDTKTTSRHKNASDEEMLYGSTYRITRCNRSLGECVRCL